MWNSHPCACAARVCYGHRPGLLGHRYLRHAGARPRCAAQGHHLVRQASRYSQAPPRRLHHECVIVETTDACGAHCVVLQSDSRGVTLQCGVFMRFVEHMCSSPVCVCDIVLPAAAPVSARPGSQSPPPPTLRDHDEAARSADCVFSRQRMCLHCVFSRHLRDGACIVCSFCVCQVAEHS